MRVALMSLLMLPLAVGCVYKDKDTGEPWFPTIPTADADAVLNDLPRMT